MTTTERRALVRIAISRHLTRWHVAAAVILEETVNYEAAVDYLTTCPTPA